MHEPPGPDHLRKTGPYRSTARPRSAACVKPPTIAETLNGEPRHRSCQRVRCITARVPSLHGRPIQAVLSSALYTPAGFAGRVAVAVCAVLPSAAVPRLPCCWLHSFADDGREGYSWRIEAARRCCVVCPTYLVVLFAVRAIRSLRRTGRKHSQGTVGRVLGVLTRRSDRLLRGVGSHVSGQWCWAHRAHSFTSYSL